MTKKEEAELILEMISNAWLKSYDQRFFQVLYNCGLYEITPPNITGTVMAFDPYHKRNKEIIDLLTTYLYTNK